MGGLFNVKPVGSKLLCRAVVCQMAESNTYTQRPARSGVRRSCCSLVLPSLLLNITRLHNLQASS